MYCLVVVFFVLFYFFFSSPDFTMLFCALRLFWKPFVQFYITTANSPLEGVPSPPLDNSDPLGYSHSHSVKHLIATMQTVSTAKTSLERGSEFFVYLTPKG